MYSITNSCYWLFEAVIAQRPIHICDGGIKRLGNKCAIVDPLSYILTCQDDIKYHIYVNGCSFLVAQLILTILIYTCIRFF